MSTFSSANITDGNLVLKECTHKIKIKYSIRLHNLGNWLIALHQKAAGSTLQMTDVGNNSCHVSYSALHTVSW